LAGYGSIVIRTRTRKENDHVAGTGKLKSLLATATYKHTETSTQQLRETKPLSAHKYFTVLTKTRKEMFGCCQGKPHHKKKEGDRREGDFGEERTLTTLGKHRHQNSDGGPQGRR
jgi:hypothetical protein